MLEVELEDNVEVVYIANPSLSPENILHVIAFELKLDITSESSKLEVMQALQTYLLDKHANNNQVVVFVEEAQSMPIETLEEIRLLSNLETNDYKLLQMVLFGQPELDEKLRLPAIRQLKERITHNFYLDPFPPADVFSYLNFRMRAVGYRGPDLFTAKAASNIERKSNGLTRRINILADKALLAAYSDGGHDINARHIKLAAKDSDFGQTLNWQPAIKISIVAAIIFASIWIGTLLPGLFYAQYNTPSSSHQEKQTGHFLPQQDKSVALKTRDTDISMPQAASLSNDTPALSLLQQRLNETQHWIQHAQDENYTIQLILLEMNSRHEVTSFLENASQLLNTDQLYIYPVAIHGRMMFSVLYSEYTLRKQAINQLRQLSPWLQKSSPYLRNIKGIKADIRVTERAISLSGGATH